METQLVTAMPLFFRWLNCLEACRAVVDGQGGIFWMSDACRSLMQGDGDLSVHNNHLHLGAAVDHARFTDLLCNATSTSSSIVVELPTKEAACVIEAVSLSDGSTRYVGLTFKIVRPDNPVQYYDFKSILGLTAAEYRVALEMLSGKNVKEIGLKLSKTEDTIRSHIRHIYEKLNVSSREAMFLTLGQFRNIS